MSARQDRNVDEADLEALRDFYATLGPGLPLEFARVFAGDGSPAGEHWYARLQRGRGLVMTLSRKSRLSSDAITPRPLPVAPDLGAHPRRPQRSYWRVERPRQPVQRQGELLLPAAWQLGDRLPALRPSLDDVWRTRIAFRQLSGRPAPAARRHAGRLSGEVLDVQARGHRPSAVGLRSASVGGDSAAARLRAHLGEHGFQPVEYLVELLA